jgi:hypothetical protein
MLQPLLTPQGLARYVRRVPRELTVWYRNLSRTSKVSRLIRKSYFRTDKAENDMVRPSTCLSSTSY